MADGVAGTIPASSNEDIPGESCAITECSNSYRAIEESTPSPSVSSVQPDNYDSLTGNQKLEKDSSLEQTAENCANTDIDAGDDGSHDRVKSTEMFNRLSLVSSAEKVADSSVDQFCDEESSSDDLTGPGQLCDDKREPLVSTSEVPSTYKTSRTLSQCSSNSSLVEENSYQESMDEDFSGENTFEEDSGQENINEENESKENCFEDNSCKESTSEEKSCEENTFKENVCNETSFEENSFVQNTIEENALKENTIDKTTSIEATVEKNYHEESAINVDLFKQNTCEGNSSKEITSKEYPWKDDTSEKNTNSIENTRDDDVSLENMKEDSASSENLSQENTSMENSTEETSKENASEETFCMEDMEKENARREDTSEESTCAENASLENMVEQNINVDYFSKTKTVKDYSCLENITVTDLGKKNTTVEIHQENPAVEDLCKETPVVEDLCMETPVVEDLCMETPVVEDLCMETPVVEDLCKETPVVKDLCKETLVVKDLCKENIVADDFYKENTSIKGLCMENIDEEDICKKSSSMEDICEEDTGIEEVFKEKASTEASCPGNTPVGDILNEDMIDENPSSQKITDEGDGLKSIEDENFPKETLSEVSYKESSVEKVVPAPRKILYSGYKKATNCTFLKPEKKIISKGNPFNPLWKKHSRCIQTFDDYGRSASEFSGTSEGNVQECTHYLGLQPSINFRCNHCGMSGFESIQVLNIHQGECRKVLGHSTSTNIKLTRKVYLCSACGTYYESWHLFYHMRKVHDKFMCLYCLGMFTYSDKLCEHLASKHQVNFINFPDIESFKKCNLSSYLFLCLECDNVMSDADNFKHTCTPQKMSTKAIPKQVPSVSIPCVGSVTVVAPPTKKTQDSNTAPKNNNLCEEPFMEDLTNFCHIDMESPKKEPPPLPEKPPEPVKEPVKSSSILSEFPKIDLQPKNLSDSSNASDRISDSKGSSKSYEDSKNNFDFSKSNENVKKNSQKNKSTKRQRMSGGRQTKRPKLDPEQQKTALDKLTETIDAVAKNYKVDDSPPAQPPVQLTTEDTPILPNHDSYLPAEQNGLDAEKRDEIIPQQFNEASKDENASNGKEKPPIWKSFPDKTIAKFKLHTDLESDEESDDSNKLSMVIDETPAHSDNDSKAAKSTIKGIDNTSDESNQDKDSAYPDTTSVPKEKPVIKPKDEIALAGEDVPAMALTLDDKVQDVKVQHILKECVRTSCTSCNYCRRAIKIAVNGKHLALHLLSEHRYTPTKNDSPEDVINKLKASLDELSNIYFNTESYDSSDPSIHVPYDKDSTFDCFQCSYVTYSHKELHIHKRKSHTKSLLLCIMCKINFYSYSELLCHLCPGHYDPDYHQLNNIDIGFRCCFCNLDTIPSAFRLMVHLRKCHHTCDICLEVCSDQQKLSTHMWKHKLNHLCYRCGIAYASKLDITKHLFWKHGTESVLCKKCLQKKWPHVYHFCIPPTSFLCEECNSSFSKAVALKVHKRIHAGDFSYPCTQCDKKFVSKKLLQKHEDQHNEPATPVEQEEKNKEEIIDVTGESTGNTEGVSDLQVDGIENQKGSDKENETSKHHKKHKKEKKAKQVIDVYDLPPLNLSSDSDSSDDESCKQMTNDEQKDSESKASDEDNGKPTIQSIDHPKQISASDKTSHSFDEIIPSELDNTLASSENQDSKDDDKLSTKDKVEKLGEDDEEFTDLKPLSTPEQVKAEQAVENTSIWENFYKTNSNNKNLPYPLCAMKSEDAYKIIMGDHDYCLQAKASDPIIKEDIIQTNIDCDTKIDSNINSGKNETNETTASDSSPTKKKQKSPKKKSGNNSSSSSDSSSDSDSSSCSCGDNCSCSSSSSDSSSSSSSDSDSSASEAGNKQRAEKRKKRKEKKSKTKAVANADQNSENKTIVESAAPPIPEEPAVRESDLETDESSTDEEFYDRQPQKLSNQLLAEKRNQLMLLASVAPVHGEGLAHELTKTSVLNDALTDLSTATPSTPDSSQPSAKKVTKNRRKKSFMMKSRKRVNKNYSFNNIPQSSDPAVHKSPKPFNVLKVKEPKRQEKPVFGALTPPSFVRTPLPTDINTSGGSESENVRASKRKRIPNKFYGYSSGEEEDRAQPKWRKPEVSTPPPPPPPVTVTPKFIHSTPQTPKIQLSVPKQIIRKNQSDPTKVRHYLSGNESTDSSSDNDKRFGQGNASHHPPVPRQPPPPPLPPPPPPPPSANKQDKNLYCYCRCPYDEVSEMIACDDENCKIEWFHFECVGISVPPIGQWFCPQCSKRRGILP